MDPNNSTSSQSTGQGAPPQNQTQVTQSNVSQSQVPVGSSQLTPSNRFQVQKKVIIIAIGVLVVIGAILVLLFVRGADAYPNYEFSINDQPVAKENVVTIYTHLSAADNPDTASIVKYIEDMYIENYILKDEYVKTGGDLSTLEIDGSGGTGNRELDMLVSQNTVLRQKVLPTLGLKVRSGEVLLLEVMRPITGSEAVVTQFISDTLTRYSHRLADESIGEITDEIASDSAVVSRNGVPRSVTFANMSTTRPVMGGEEFLDAVFTTPPNSVSSIFSVPLRDRISYGVVMVRQAGDGTYVDYREWLQEKKSALSIKKDFRDFQ